MGFEYFCIFLLGMLGICFLGLCGVNNDVNVVYFIMSNNIFCF